jgi:chromosome condensin MukBEF ATPase and DNA-binding subunit MukB
MSSDRINTEVTASEVATQIANAPEFQAVAIPMNQQQDRLREQARPFPLSTMEEGINRLSQDLEQTTRSELSELLDSAAQIEDPSQRARELDIIRRTIRAERQNFSSRLRSFAEQRSVWLKPGGGGWNQEAVNGFARDASAAFDQMEQRLRRLEQELKAERAQAETGGQTATSSPEAPAPRTQTTGPGGGNPGAGEPPIAEWWRRTVENMPANRGNPLGDR